MAVGITSDTMTLEIDDRVVATARFSELAAADGTAWIVATRLVRHFDSQAITALTIAELLAAAFDWTGALNRIAATAARMIRSGCYALNHQLVR